MKTILLIFVLAALAGCQNDTPMPARTFVLVHGGWHGSWAWKKVTPLLEAQGHRVVALDLPSHGADKTPPETVTLETYIQKIVSVANAQTGPVTLVGHSSGGMFIAQAAEQLGVQKVEKLVFLDAFLPKNGQSLFALAGQYDPPTPGTPKLSDSFIMQGPVIALDVEKAVPFLYHDCSAEDVAFAKANLGKQPVNVPTQCIAPLATSHSPFFSNPQALADLLIQL
ncbi:MAG: alpha/beta fold hydrolase [Cytophagales bacterium]|nr:alpha/beta fold hydrolase [Cytophagales bacterium]